MIKIADDVKIIGHNLKGIKFILNPVTKDTIAIIMRKHDEVIYVAIDMMFIGSITVTMTIRTPTKISATPSTSHSISIMFLLSWLISPNPRTTDLVGNRWATPHIKGSKAPEYISTKLNKLKTCKVVAP